MIYSIVGITKKEKFSVLHTVCCDENDKVGMGCSVRTLFVKNAFLPKFDSLTEIIGLTCDIKPYKKGDKWLDYITFKERR